MRINAGMLASINNSNGLSVFVSSANCNRLDSIRHKKNQFHHSDVSHIGNDVGPSIVQAPKTSLTTLAILLASAVPIRADSTHFGTLPHRGDKRVVRFQDIPFEVVNPRSIPVEAEQVVTSGDHESELPRPHVASDVTSLVERGSETTNEDVGEHLGDKPGDNLSDKRGATLNELLSPIADIDPMLAIDPDMTPRSNSPTSHLNMVAPDVTRPIEFELANDSIDAVHGSHVASSNAEFEPPHDGYGGLVDTYVHQFLNGDIAISGGLTTTDAGTPTSHLSHKTANRPAGASGWYAIGEFLLLERWGESQLATSVNSATANVELSTRDAEIDWSEAAAARVGLRTGHSAIEFGWWSLFSTTSTAIATSATGDLDSVIDFAELDVDFNSAMLHHLESQTEVHSFDISKRSRLSGWNSGLLQFSWMVGMRFTRLSDELRFHADSLNTVLGDAAGEQLYEIEVDNRLVGPQIGGTAYWQATPSVGLSLESRAGVYYNYIDMTQSASDNLGTSQIISGPDAGRLFNIERTDEQAAALAEMQLQVQYRFRPRVSLTAGYRVFAASGVAVTNSQVPWRFGSLEASQIDASSSFLLHGLQLGLDTSF